MGAAEALVFDFNGTLSDDEPLLLSIYQQLFARHGRPLPEDAYYGDLAGNSEETIIGTWLGVDGPLLAMLVQERIDAYTALAASGSTVTSAGAGGRSLRGCARPGGDRVRGVPGRDRAGRGGCGDRR